MTKARKTQSTSDGSLSTHNGFSLISNEKLLEIYSTMLKCRMLEERLNAVSKQSKNAKQRVHASVHIAAIAGAAIDLEKGDKLAPSPGALTPCFAKGMPLDAIFGSLNGGSGSFGSRNLIRPTLSAEKQIERALEAAVRCKTKRNKKVVAVFSSDLSGAADELEETMRRAGKKKLPILFVCETKREDDDRISRAKKFGFPGVAVEDDDAVAVYRVATEALAHARRGNGPTLILCKPWPFTERGKGHRRHTMNPISKMEAYLASKGLFNRKFKSQVVAEFGRELDAAVEASEQ